MRLSDEELLKDIAELADKLGHPPTLQEYRESGSHSATTYYERFGSWKNAIEAAGFDSRDPNSEILEAKLLEELTRLGEEFDTTPTVELMNTHGKHWLSTYRHHFGSWSNALEAAGFDPDANRPGVTDEELVAELRHLGDELGEPPTMAEMADQGAHAVKTYREHFGSWNNSLRAAGFEPRENPSSVQDEELEAELRRMADELGRPPKAQEMTEDGEYSVCAYQNHWGSWTTARANILDDTDCTE